MKFNNKIANKAIKNVLLDQILKANEKLTFIAMVECFDFSKGYSEISISEIGEAITIKNRNTICNIVKKLETLGYIKVIHQNGKTNVYQITKYLNFKYDEERNIKKSFNRCFRRNCDQLSDYDRHIDCGLGW